MTLQEALKTKQKIKRDSWTSKELYLYLDNNSYLCTKEYHMSLDDSFYIFTVEDLLADDWSLVTKQEENKPDKILAAELVINLLKTLTEEINKSNNKIMEAVEAKDIVVTNSLISIQSELFEINKQLKTLTSPQWFVPPVQPLYPTVTYALDATQFPIGANPMNIGVGDQIKTGDPSAPIATVTDVSWYKRGESNGE